MKYFQEGTQEITLSEWNECVNGVEDKPLWPGRDTYDKNGGLVSRNTY